MIYKVEKQNSEKIYHSGYTIGLGTIFFRCGRSNKLEDAELIEFSNDQDLVKLAANRETTDFVCRKCLFEVMR